MIEFGTTSEDKSYSFPSRIDEFSPGQFLQFLAAYKKLMDKEISYHDFKIMMLFHLLDIRGYHTWYKAVANDQKVKIQENVFRLSEQLNDLFKADKDDDGNIKLSIDFSSWMTNLLPKYKGYIGPADMFSDVVGMEYKQVYVASNQFIKTQKVDYLNEICALLYRKPLLPFMEKPAFDSGNVAGINKKVSRWPYHVKYGVFLNFMAFQYQLKHNTFNLDGIDVCFAPLFSGSGSESKVGLTAVFYTLAESKVFGNLAETSNQNIYDILYRLYQLHVTYLEQKSKKK